MTKKNEGTTATEERPALTPARRAEILRNATAGKDAATKLSIAAQFQSLPDEMLQEVFGEDLSTLELNSVVAGRPLHNWLGKTKGQILNELQMNVVSDVQANPEGEDAEALYDEVEDALTNRGWVIGDEPIVRKIHDIHVEAELRGLVGMAAPLRDEDGNLRDIGEMFRRRQEQSAARAGTRRAVSASTSVDTFGDDQIPATDLPDSVEAIMNLPPSQRRGIGEKTAQKIVDYKREKGLIGAAGSQRPASALGAGDFDANPNVEPPVGGGSAAGMQSGPAPDEEK